MGKLKDAIIKMANSSDTITEKDIRLAIKYIYHKRGIKPYKGDLFPIWKKGYFRYENNIVIYKTECPELPENRLSIKLSIYGIDNRDMFYTIDILEFDSLNREEQLTARIWSDMCNGLYDMEYN